MFHTVALACLLTAAAAAPATYDQRQDGAFNARADIKNIVLIVAYPQRMNLPIAELMGGLKTSKPDQFQERADVRLTEAFVEPSTPYRVEIGSEGEGYPDGDARNVVYIDGRRRLESGPPVEAEGEKEEYKLLGAQEQCGPDRERDPVSLTCRPRAPAPPAPAPAQPDPKPDEPAQPEAIPVSS